MAESQRSANQGVGSADLADALRAAHALLSQAATSGALSSSLTEMSDSTLIGLLGSLREIRSVTAAIEARAQCTFDESQRAAAQQRGVSRKDLGKGVADQIALARGVSVYRAANDLALVRGLVRELPATYARLAWGRISEQAALAVARETICLTPEDRALVDTRVAPRLGPRTGARHAATLARAEAARVDAESVTARIRIAESQRCVTVRPAPDAMVYLSALLPVKEGVAAYAALDRHATSAKASGDARSRGSLMADELFRRLTGLDCASDIPVEIQLVMPAETLLTASDPGSGGEPTVAGEVAGRIADHVIPASLCREIALIPSKAARRWVRRVFTDPISGQVRAVDERRRLFSGAMREAIVLRDQACRTCGAPVREVDHVTSHASGGPTTHRNAQGLCQRCNQTKTLPGWASTAFEIDGSHLVMVKTPTGRRYLSQAPPVLPGWQATKPDRHASPTETRAGPIEQALAAAPSIAILPEQISPRTNRSAGR